MGLPLKADDTAEERAEEQLEDHNIRTEHLFPSNLLQ